MATTIWRGGTVANIRQVSDLPITTDGTNYAQGDTITLTIGNSTFVVTIGTLVTTAQVATTVFQAYTGTTLTDTSASASVGSADGGATSIGQFAEFTATNGTSSHVTFTANQSGALAGKPITMTVSTNSSHGLVSSYNTTTTAQSQYTNTAANWSGNATPANNDTIVFDNGNFDMRYSMTLTTQPAAITKYKAYTGNVGLGYMNVDNNAKPYPEYRTRYFTTANNSVTTTANLEVGEGQGSGRFMWDAGAGQVAMSVFGKGTRADTGVPCILFKGTNASNVVNNLAGDVGIAFFGGETATVATLVTGDGPTSQANTVCGSGCTLTTVTLNGGTQETNSAITTANQNGGTWVHKSGTVTTANIYAGTHYPNGGATYTTLKVFGGTFDASKGNSSFTITNTIEMYKGAKFIDPQGRSGSPVFHLNGCVLADVTITLPDGKTYTIS